MDQYRMRNLKKRQYGFNLIELGQMVFIFALIFAFYLIGKGNRFGVALAFLLINFVAMVFLFSNTQTDAIVAKPRLSRITFLCLVALCAPVVWWLHSLIAVIVGAFLSYAIAFNLYRYRRIGPENKQMNPTDSEPGTKDH